MEIPFLKDVVVILGLSVIVLLLFNRAKIPAVLAFFVTGVLAGPQGLGLVGSSGEVELLAELGVIFLLFTIGIEFSLERFSQIKRYAIIGGSLQLTLTLTAVYFLCLLIGLSNPEAIFIGFLVSFSSTAIVLRILQEKNEIYSVQGQLSLGILIFQDIAVVLVILFTPLLSGSSTSLSNWPFLIATGAGLIIFTIISTRWLVPELLHYMARFKSRDLFLLTIILICFGVTWITSAIGLSPALGAFLAGLIISNTEYSHQALGNILPFQDIFLSFFFVSIGMLLNLGFLVQNLPLVLGIVVVVLLLKSVIAGITTGILGLPFRIMILVGLILSQIGEFSFILSATGVQLGLISQNIFQLFLSVSVITMSLTPFIMAIAPRISDYSNRIPVPEKIRHGLRPMHIPEEMVWEDHLIIVGFGINGKNMAHAASKAHIPYVVVELNPEIIRQEQSKGESVFYGDAAQETVLKKVNVREARIMVVAISDPVGTRKIIDAAKKLNPNLYIIVRTRYIREMEYLFNLGADEVIPEEFETSVEIFSRVLDQYQLNKEEIDEFITDIRSDNYEMFRSLSRDQIVTCNLEDGDQPTIKSEIIRKDNKWAGKPVQELKQEGIILISIIREEKTISNPPDTETIMENDILLYNRP